MVPSEIALLNLVRSLDDDVSSGLYERPRVVHLASKMSDPDLASMAVHSQQPLVIEVAQQELQRRGLDANGDPIPTPQMDDEHEDLDMDLDLDLDLSFDDDEEDEDLDDFLL